MDGVPISFDTKELGLFFYDYIILFCKFCLLQPEREFPAFRNVRVWLLNGSNVKVWMDICSLLLHHAKITPLTTDLEILHVDISHAHST